MLELILVLVIILLLFKQALNSYFKKPYFDKKTEQALSEQGIDTTNYKAILDSTKEKIKNIDKQLMDQEKRIEDIK